MSKRQTVPLHRQGESDGKKSGSPFYQKNNNGKRKKAQEKASQTMRSSR